jgi:DNA-binding response OmpR family regulator
MSTTSPPGPSQASPVCSGEAGPQEVARLLELGVRRYYRKPVEPDELLATVEAALREGMQKAGPHERPAG